MAAVQVQTIIPAPEPEAVMRVVTAHLRDAHEIEFKRRNDGTHYFEQPEFRLELCPRAAGLFVSLRGSDRIALTFIQEDIVSHLARLDAGIARRIRWEGDVSRPGELPADLAVLTVVGRRRVFSGMQRVTLHYPGIAKTMGIGIHFRLMLPLVPGRVPVWPVMGANGAPVWPRGSDALHARFVTIKAVRADVEEVDVDIVRHDGGLISDWAERAGIGTQAGAMGPVGPPTLPDAARYFIAADGTGLPAVARILATLPVDAVGHVVVAAPDECDLATYLPQTKLEIMRMDPGRFEAEIVDHARAVNRRDVVEYGLFLGEFGTAQQMRKHFKQDLGLGKDAQVSVAYWRRGVPGFGS